MKYPVFDHSTALYNIQWLLALPVLIDICTACTLFSFWIVWCFYFCVVVIGIIRAWHGFAQKCYKFGFGMIGMLLLCGAVLGYFQLSFNDVINTPVSHPVTSDIVRIANPMQQDADTTAVHQLPSKTPVH